VDQSNTFDAKPGDWMIGEDMALGAWRNMQNPTSPPNPCTWPNCIGDQNPRQPDKMSSTYYYEGSADYGGVHINSGVNNKAVFLMAAVGTIGGKTYSGIGWDKTLKIYYRAQTRLLSSGSDYLDLYNAIDQSCRTLMVSGDVTGSDCQKVREALDAVEMNKEPATNFNPKVPLCPSGYVDDYYYLSDDMETDYGNWVFDSFTGGLAWERKEGYSYTTSDASGIIDGNWSLFADWSKDYPADNYAGLTFTIDIPTNPADTYLHFAHAYKLPPTTTNLYHAGGVLEYSTDSGATRTDASSLWNAGKNYTSTISSLWNSVIGGRKAFTGISNGYVESRYKLNPKLAGKSVNFYWRFANGDMANKIAGRGWWVDNVQIYTCVKTPATPTLSSPINNAFVSNAITQFNWSDSTPVPDHYQIQVSENPGFYTVIADNDTGTSDFILIKDLSWNTTYYWRVRTHNSAGASAWSTTGKFRTPLQYPSRSWPFDGITITTNNRPYFDWTSISGAVSYTLQVSTSSSFSTNEINVTTPTTTSPPSEYTHTSDLKKANTTYYWHVKANSSTACNCASTWSLAGSFTSANPPSVPTLSSPANKALVTDYTPLLDWSDSTLPSGTYLDSYQIVVSQSADFSSPIFDEYRVPSSFTPPTNLQSRTTYYWRVRAWNTNNHVSAWSSIWYFKTSILPPVLPSPGDYSTTKILQPLLDWQNVPEATGYTVEVSRSASFASKDFTGTPKTSEYSFTKDLYAGTQYYWRVKTNGPDGPSTWSTWTFTTGKPPTMPTPVYPIDNNLIFNYTPPIMWSSSSLWPGTDFDHYELVLASDNKFTDVLVQENLPGILNNKYYRG
jgi:hypothetical protein